MIALVIFAYVILFIAALLIGHARRVPLTGVALVSLFLSPAVGIMFAAMINEREFALFKGEIKE